MPIHDWTRVRANRFHDFHQSWTVEICNALNAGRLPPGYLQTPASPQACASAFCVLATSWLVTKALIASV